MNSVAEDKDGTNVNVDKDKEEQSPAKKHSGLSRSSTKKSNPQTPTGLPSGKSNSRRGSNIDIKNN
jgi:hypothetical protein